MSIPTACTALGQIRVLDFSRVRAGPTCVRMLADFGADVIRIEPPADTDPNATMFAEDRCGGDFQNLNRNKRSMTLNLKAPEARGLVHRLVEQADVVVENWRPDVKQRLGLDYETLSAINPRIILASISGFGQTGPYVKRPAFDQIIQGMGGLMSVTGLPGQGPVRAGMAVADSSSGIYTAVGILVALIERAQSGRGQWVQTSLLHALIAMMDFQIARYLNDDEVPGQAGNSHPTSSPMGLFRARDGHLNIGVSGPGMWEKFCQVMGRPQWLEDPRFTTTELRVRHRDALDSMVQDVLSTDTVAHWVERLTGGGVPAGPVYSVPQLLEDAQVRHARVSTSVRVEGCEKPRHYVTQPVLLSRTPAQVVTGGPMLGGSTRDILAQLGCSAAEMDLWASKGVI
ncbi:CaiB/BaiF CoA transferase family protein [Castellaniella sp.]|uniref:CaiB/BaiF CoA transferase family protein n=1 Tax=Castellaniella sp. TaxID=1955812 RepID=UPI0035622854